LPTYIAPVPSPLYNRDILRLAAAIPHLGRLEAPHACSERVSPVCGSRVTVEVRVDARGQVAELAQEVRACALGQAAASLMAAHAIGRAPAELARARDHLAAYLAGSRDDPGQWPGLAVLEPARPYSARHASILLPFEAAAEAAALAARPAAAAR
jgi:NifU-like protein involved in Fe-S cluster formation